MNNQQLYGLSKELSGKDAIKSDIDKTYNKLLNHYKSILKIGFEINCFPIKEQTSFLIEILKLKESDKNFLFTNTPEKKFPNRKLIDNLQKDDMELDKEELIDFFIKKGIVDNAFIPNFISFKDVSIIDFQNKEMIKQNIRYSPKNYTHGFRDPYRAILNYTNSVDVEINLYEKMGMKNLKQEILVTDLIEESYSYLFLQSIIYQIIKNQNIKKEQ
jgi:hypothetical protein